MKNIMKRLCAFSLVLFLASLAQAAITMHKPDSLTQKAVSGEVVSIDAGKLVIKDGSGNELALVVNASTKVTKGGKAGSPADVKAGEKVTVEVAEAEGKLVAQSIKVE